MELESELLREQLPETYLRPYVEVDQFFERCEAIAHEAGFRIDRRREFAGPGYDQLNLYLGAGERDLPMLRMVSSPSLSDRLKVDVVAEWKSPGPAYEEYLETLKHSYLILFREYGDKHGRRLRLGVPRRAPRFDPTTVGCNRISYALEKLNSVMHTLTVGQGDARDRLKSASWNLLVLRADDLPVPLDRHWTWIMKKLTAREPRYQGEGSVEASLAQMRNSTASQIAERILKVHNALREIDRKVCGGSEYFT